MSAPLTVIALIVDGVDGPLARRYEVKKNPTSASVGVSMIGSVSVPLPIGSNVNLVRVGSNTVQNQAFYARLFDRVAFHLPGTPAHLPPPPEPDEPPDPVLLPGS